MRACIIFQVLWNNLLDLCHFLFNSHIFWKPSFILQKKTNVCGCGFRDNLNSKEQYIFMPASSIQYCFCSYTIIIFQIDLNGSFYTIASILVVQFLPQQLFYFSQHIIQYLLRKPNTKAKVYTYVLIHGRHFVILI